MAGPKTILAVAFTMAAFYAVAGDFSFHVSVAPEWNQMFQRTKGWIGADATVDWARAAQGTSQD